jgi:hypothetical protein
MGRLSGTADFFNVRAIRETPKAVFCEIGDDTYWVPKSQIGAGSEILRDGDFGTLVVSAWWAEQSGLFGDAEPKTPPSAAADFKLSECSKVYRRLAFEHHPDRGGDSRVMQAINQLWDAVRRDLKHP